MEDEEDEEGGEVAKGHVSIYARERPFSNKTLEYPSHAHSLHIHHHKPTKELAATSGMEAEAAPLS